MYTDNCISNCTKHFKPKNNMDYEHPAFLIDVGKMTVKKCKVGNTFLCSKITAVVYYTLCLDNIYSYYN